VVVVVIQLQKCACIASKVLQPLATEVIISPLVTPTQPQTCSSSVIFSTPDAQIFSFVSGAELVIKETLCGCSSHSTAEVREYVRALNTVKTIDEVRCALEFTSTCP
jgi:hypothetical protein